MAKKKRRKPMNDTRLHEEEETMDTPQPAPTQRFGQAEARAWLIWAMGHLDALIRPLQGAMDVLAIDDRATADAVHDELELFHEKLSHAFLHCGKALAMTRPVPAFARIEEPEDEEPIDPDDIE